MLAQVHNALLDEAKSFGDELAQVIGETNLTLQQAKITDVTCRLCVVFGRNDLSKVDIRKGVLVALKLLPDGCDHTSLERRLADRCLSATRYQ